MLTYMCLGCKMKDYIYFLSFKELLYKIRFTNISLNRKKKKRQIIFDKKQSASLHTKYHVRNHDKGNTGYKQHYQLSSGPFINAMSKIRPYIPFHPFKKKNFNETYFRICITINIRSSNVSKNTHNKSTAWSSNTEAEMPSSQSK